MSDIHIGWGGCRGAKNGKIHFDVALPQVGAVTEKHQQVFYAKQLSAS